MPQQPFAGGAALPRWLVVAGSAVIVYHLAAVIIPILDVPSGPWLSMEGPQPMPAPKFAQEASGLSTVQTDYLRLTHNYHFDSNRLANIPGVQMEVKLHYTDGKPPETLQFPDPNANPWVRHRQELLARYLAPDIPVQPPQSEVIAPRGEKPITLQVWAFPGEDFSGSSGPPPAPGTVTLELRSVPQHRIPRPPAGRSVMRPPDLGLVMVHSYCRYLCRTHGAATAEIIRHTREPVAYAVLMGNPTPDLDEISASFGEMSE